ncbi:MAG: 4-hydroxy-tetrahydrodipicolinate reductase [Gemmatimonadota bacterium]
MPARIVVSGALGRMGQTIAGLARDSSAFVLSCGIDRERPAPEDPIARQLGFAVYETPSSAAAAIQQADVVIDFSAPDGLQALLDHCGAALAGKALVVGTTGLSNELQHQLRQASEHAAIMVSANYSIGVNLMLGVVASAAKVLTADRFDVEIVEAHHRHKADAPSGTALLLGRVIAEARGVTLDAVRRDGRAGKTGERPTGEIGFHALRGGEVVGEHRVQFLGGRERFEITHAASDRAIFAEGALIAAQWLAGKPAGMYSMQDVLDLE